MDNPPDKSNDDKNIPSTPIVKTRRSVPERNSAEKAKKFITHYYSTKQGMYTPKREGMNARYTDVYRGDSESSHKLERLRGYFDQIVKQLNDKNPDKRMRYIRKSEKPITLKDLIDFGTAMDREVGIFLDENFSQRKSKRTHKETPILIYAEPGNSSAANVGASIKFPPQGSKRFRIIAHYHPTSSNATDQLTKDISSAGKEIEMVVNSSGNIFYYNESGCFNIKENNPRGSQYKSELSLKVNHLFNLNTPITIQNIQEILDKILVNEMVIPREQSTTYCPLFDDDFELKDEESVDSKSDKSQNSTKQSEEKFSTSRNSFFSTPDRQPNLEQDENDTSADITDAEMADSPFGAFARLK